MEPYDGSEPGKNAMKVERAQHWEKDAARLEEEALCRYLETGSEAQLTEYELACHHKWRVFQVRARLESRQDKLRQLSSRQDEPPRGDA